MSVFGSEGFDLEVDGAVTFKYVYRSCGVGYVCVGMIGGLDVYLHVNVCGWVKELCVCEWNS